MVSDRLLQKVQAASGIGFGSFLTLHLTNTLCGHFGPRVYDAVQNIFRLYYQTPAVEIFMVFGTLAIHVGSSMLRCQKRWKSGTLPPALSSEPQSQPQSLRTAASDADKQQPLSAPALQSHDDPKRLRLRDAGPPLSSLSLERQLHRLTGYALNLLLLGHVFVVRVCPLIAGISPDMTFITASVAISGPIFTLYYCVLAACGLFHGLLGLSLALSTLGYRRPALVPAGGRSIWKSFLPLAALLCSAVTAISGYYFDIPIPRLHTDFHAIHQVYLPYLPPALVSLMGY